MADKFGSIILRGFPLDGWQGKVQQDLFGELFGPEGLGITDVQMVLVIGTVAWGIGSSNR